MCEWRFLLDENVDPKTASYLEKEGVHAEHVRDALWLGADDESDILPYVTEHDCILVTSDISDFGALSDDAHAGLVLLFDDTLPAYRIASALLAMIEAYPDRSTFPGTEVLDDWV